MKVSTVLDSIDLGNMALPEFQRGYVWNREQVRALMQSLYKKYPVGGLLIWSTSGGAAATRGTNTEAANTVIRIRIRPRTRLRQRGHGSNRRL